MKKVLLLAILSIAITIGANASKIEKKTYVIKQDLKITKVNSEEVLGYMYYLYNDGCYHLGRIVRRDDGSVWWEPLISFINYIGKTTICMSDFDNFC